MKKVRADSRKPRPEQTSVATKSLTFSEARTLLSSINMIVSSDFAQDMEFKLLPNSQPYTQEEAEKMAQTIGRVYMHSHQITCIACRRSRHTALNDLEPSDE